MRLMGCACGRTRADALDTRVHATSAFGRARPGAAYVRPGCSGTAGECGASDWVESRGRLGCSSSDTQVVPPSSTFGGEVDESSVGAAHRCHRFARYTLVCHTRAGKW